MAAAAESSQQPSSVRAFALGFGALTIVYASLGGFLWLKAPDTLQRREARLASQTVDIDRGNKVEIPAEGTGELYGPPAPAETVAPGPEESIASDPVAAPLPEGSLARAPIEGLYEDTADGRLPVINAAENLTPFEAYRRPFTPVPGKPVVSVAVMDAGLSDSASRAVLAELSPEVSVVVTPYAPAPDYWLAESRLSGHEVWLRLPVEPDFYPMDDSGPQTLLVNAIERQNYNKLVWAMTRGAGYAGFVAGPQSAFMKSENDVRPVISEIFRRGLGFVDSETTPSALPGSVANDLKAPYAHNDVWIDMPATTEHIAASLRQLEVLAQREGSAIGFIHSTPTGLKMLQSWIDGLPQKNIVLAPLSAQMAKAP